MREQFANLVNAAFSAIWIESFENEEAQREIVQLGQEKDWLVSSWDCVRGIQHIGGTSNPADTAAPIIPLRYFFGQPKEKDKKWIVLLHNYHRFLENSQVVQGLINASLIGKSTDIHFVVLSPVKSLPVELERIFTIIEHPLPAAGEIREIGKKILEENAAGGNVDEESVSAARGLTRRQVEDAFSLSITQNGGILPATIWDLKKGFINEREYLSFSRGGPGFDSLGGLENLKEFSKKLLRLDNPVPTKGILLLGPPGTGKSAFCKALGNETGRPTITLDFGAIYHKHVGESERQIRDALSSADAMGKVILFIDEIEKSLSGVGGDGDSGVATRAFGTFLTWLSDREEKGSDVFVVATSNDISKLPPEFTRAERFDAVFFIDLPTRLERGFIWDIWQGKYGVMQQPVQDEGWCGAEIKSCCRLALSMGVSLKEAAEYIVPISITAGEKIKDLREWAKGRCLSAHERGYYTGTNAAPIPEGTPQRRKLSVKKQEEVKE